MRDLITIFGGLFSATLLATTALAHGPSKGPNSGAQIDAGDYHVEMVTKGTALTVYLHDDKDKPVDAKGYKVTGRFVIARSPQRIELAPERANRLTGASPVALPDALKGAVNITLPSSKTVQVKF